MPYYRWWWIPVLSDFSSVKKALVFSLVHPLLILRVHVRSRMQTMLHIYMATSSPDIISTSLSISMQTFGLLLNQIQLVTFFCTVHIENQVSPGIFVSVVKRNNIWIILIKQTKMQNFRFFNKLQNFIDICYFSIFSSHKNTWKNRTRSFRTS